MWITRSLFSDCNCKAVLAATATQVIWAFFFYGFVMSNVFRRALCVDKGVKAYTSVTKRYSMPVCSLTTAFSCFVQAEIINAVHKKMGLKKTLGGYTDVSLWVAVGVLVFAHQKFWAQRPKPYILLDAINNVMTNLVCGATLFFAQHIM